ncbi:MAG TPA: nicotinate (nicotinamide) nucleotide adenylyltransferase [Burkholderiaceae bacterium]|jgi:nicotinate-nucleotide adenylyltransferase
MALNIGLFGGSFDPPHLAHLALAHAALDQLKLDRVLWVPVGDPWQKPRQLAAPEHRRAMVELLIAGEPRFALDDCELLRQGPSYTIDTVEAHLGDNLALIIGQDQYAHLHTWHRWQALLPLVTLAVAARAGEPIRPNVELERIPHRVIKLDMPAMTTSSTSVRAGARTMLGSGDISPLVGGPVAGYIAQHGLYSEQ